MLLGLTGRSVDAKSASLGKLGGWCAFGAMVSTSGAIFRQEGPRSDAIQSPLPTSRWVYTTTMGVVNSTFTTTVRPFANRTYRLTRAGDLRMMDLTS